MSYYYTVLVGSAQYHGNEALTYSSDQKLPLRAIVKVPLQKLSVLGVVTGEVTKPRFATKNILDRYPLPVLAAHVIQLISWLRQYYPAPLGAVTQQILPSQLTDKLIPEISGITESIVPDASELPEPTPEQAAVLQAIDKPDTYLLHGDTGTGKTRVYIALALQCISAGKSAIIMTPEIGLTSQLAQSFMQVFGDRVVVVHSQLTPKARQSTWLKIIKSTQPVIVLGPRSALFSPVNRLGLIVVDESHEPSYKQESAPHYHASRVAAWLANAHRAVLILGSATPSINDYFLAEQRGKKILRMQTQARLSTSSAGTQDLSSRRLGSAGYGTNTIPRDPQVPRRSGADVPTKTELDAPGQQGSSARLKTDHVASPALSAPGVTTELVDLTDRTNFTRSQHLSTPLLKAIDGSLGRNEQSLLYLNRRGTARVILCNNCGWQAGCPHCDLPLTYHHDVHLLQCHTCGYNQRTPSSCLDCNNVEIVFKVVGTKAIEEEVQRLYPGARVMRFDTDNKKSERFEQHYEAVARGEVDIIVGTQLLAKGLDLPRLSTLGVVIADTSLTFPDYSAEERTFQLLQQVVGRVGRGHGSNEKIIVQSYAPDRPVIQAALARDWDTFYKTEKRERELFFFPPFSYVLKLSCRRASSKAAETASEKFMQSLQQLELPMIIEGPMPSFHARIAGKYEWQLILKSKQRSALIQALGHLPKSGWTYDIDPINLL